MILMCQKNCCNFCGLNLSQISISRGFFHYRKNRRFLNSCVLLFSELLSSCFLRVKKTVVTFVVLFSRRSVDYTVFCSCV